MAGASADPTIEDFHTPDGVRLRVRAWGRGDAPLVVLLHGGGANGAWWLPIAPALAERFHAVALDFRGHGDSEFPEERFVGAFHRDLEALVAHLGPASLSLVGHSLGAHIALDFAARDARVNGVVAIEAGRGAKKSHGRRARLALAARRTYPTREDAVARYRFLPEAGEVPETLRRRIAEASVREERDGRHGYKFDPHWFRLPASPPAPRENIQGRCLIVRGAASELLTTEGAAQLASEIPQARVIEIPGGGHNVHLEQPAAVAAEILDHLDPPGGRTD